MAVFKSAHAIGRDWQAACRAALDKLGDLGPQFTLGFAYVSDPAGGDLGAIHDTLRTTTGITDWVGAVGFGICGLAPADKSKGDESRGDESRGDRAPGRNVTNGMVGGEYFDQPAVALLVTDLPRADYRIFAAANDLADFHARHDAWIAEARPQIAVVHGDSHNPHALELISRFAEETGTFLVGGMASFTSAGNQIAGEIVSGGLSGVMLSSRVAVVSGLSQGSAPLGLVHQITNAQGNVLISLDGERALDVLMEDVGCDTDEQLRRLAAHVNVALLVPGSDTGDYVVRNLVGIDAPRGLVAIGDTVEPGDRLMFCGCDRDSAVRDLRRMVGSLAERAGDSPNGALYFSCVARGPNLFGPNAEEVTLLGDGLGSIPLAGFYANGEISNDRLYGYTGILVVFR